MSTACRIAGQALRQREVITVPRSFSAQQLEPAGVALEGIAGIARRRARLRDRLKARRAFGREREGVGHLGALGEIEFRKGNRFSSRQRPTSAPASSARGPSTPHQPREQDVTHGRGRRGRSNPGCSRNKPARFTKTCSRVTAAIAQSTAAGRPTRQSMPAPWLRSSSLRPNHQASQTADPIGSPCATAPGTASRPRSRPRTRRSCGRSRTCRSGRCWR